jgi:hypothetical protein
VGYNRSAIDAVQFDSLVSADDSPARRRDGWNPIGVWSVGREVILMELDRNSKLSQKPGRDLCLMSAV